MIRAGPVHVLRNKVQNHLRALWRGLDKLHHAFSGFLTPRRVGRARAHEHAVFTCFQVVLNTRLAGLRIKDRLAHLVHFRLVDFRKVLFPVLAKNADHALRVINDRDKVDQDAACVLHRCIQVVAELERADITFTLAGHDRLAGLFVALLAQRSLVNARCGLQAVCSTADLFCERHGGRRRHFALRAAVRGVRVHIVDQDTVIVGVGGFPDISVLGHLLGRRHVRRFRLKGQVLGLRREPIIIELLAILGEPDHAMPHTLLTNAVFFANDRNDRQVTTGPDLRLFQHLVTVRLGHLDAHTVAFAFLHDHRVQFFRQVVLVAAGAVHQHAHRRGLTDLAPVLRNPDRLARSVQPGAKPRFIVLPVKADRLGLRVLLRKLGLAHFLDDKAPVCILPRCHDGARVPDHRKRVVDRLKQDFLLKAGFRRVVRQNTPVTNAAACCRGACRHIRPLGRALGLDIAHHAREDFSDRLGCTASAGDDFHGRRICPHVIGYLAHELWQQVFRDARAGLRGTFALKTHVLRPLVTGNHTQVGFHRFTIGHVRRPALIVALTDFLQEIVVFAQLPR